jgi:hypothetical protein
MECVFCTHDMDFVRLSASGIEHTGIIVGQQEKHWIGEWVNGLTLYYAVYTSEDMLNRLDYLWLTPLPPTTDRDLRQATAYLCATGAQCYARPALCLPAAASC